jgi:acyl-homoserine-lactone acylase
MNPYRFLLFLLFVGVNFYCFAFEKINSKEIQIVRDSFGTPYIYAKTDAQVAYGLAWANSEDAFAVIQETVLSGVGRYGEVAGKDGAKRDFLVKSLQLKERVDTMYDISFSEAYKKYVNGYVQGLNAYAQAHPNECKLKGVFPITDKQYLQGTMFICCYMQYVHKEIQKIMSGKYDEAMSHQGSNFFAFNSNKTIDGNTYLCANPHQPMEGPFSWYEAHLKSEEGLDVHGCLFFGGASVAIGSTTNLGWSMTFNSLDLVDVYRLTTRKEKDKIFYEYNNEWRLLAPVKVDLNVKVLGIKIKVNKTTYTSIHGPVYESENGEYYAVRCGGLFNIKANEQLYMMNKSTNFKEWYTALETQGLPRYNITYADKEDNIFYINHGQIPNRVKGFDYKKPLDGNNPTTLWTSYIKETDLPQVKNPSCGYVFNMNNSEFTCTCPEAMQDSTDHIKFPKEAGYRITENNRSMRFMELVKTKNKFDFDAFRNIKYDVSFPEHSAFMSSLASLYSIDKNKYPDISSEIGLIQKWNRVVDTNSVAATLAICTFHFLFEDKHYGAEIFLTGVTCTESEWVKYIRITKAHLTKYFKSTNIPYGNFCRQMRGASSTPTVGFPDMLQASYAKPNKQGIFEVYIGDSYLQFTKFDKSGILSCESMLPYGVSSRPESKHYTDQMKLYVSKTCKPVYFSKDLLLQHSEQNYWLK